MLLMPMSWVTKMHKLASHLNRTFTQIINSIRVNIPMEILATIISHNLRHQIHFSKTILKKINKPVIQSSAKKGWNGKKKNNNNSNQNNQSFISPYSKNSKPNR